MERQKPIGSIERPRIPTEINLLLLAMVLTLLQLTQAPSLEAQGPQPPKEAIISTNGTKPNYFDLKEIGNGTWPLQFRYPGPIHPDGMQYHEITKLSFYNQAHAGPNLISISLCAEPVVFSPPVKVNPKDKFYFKHRASSDERVIEPDIITVALNTDPQGKTEVEECDLKQFTVLLEERLPPPFIQLSTFVPSLNMTPSNESTNPTVTPTPISQPTPTPSLTPPQDLRPYHLYMPNLRKEVTQQKGNR